MLLSPEAGFHSIAIVIAKVTLAEFAYSWVTFSALRRRFSNARS